jgi:DNA integrity scanning protein DisA with diadenylate cyclase activity|tara:strand:- start:365 stop:628 length:264 start_codon:yes stop_codon:yes gene_type:complete
MRDYIYKTIIAVIALIIVFEFTIGKSINQINQKVEILFTKEGRKNMVDSIKIEMEKAIKKENYLNEDERKLINQFILKIKKELNTIE